ncbi:protein of unknown function [Hyphomicrobium sp. 1Nfss2.1]
MPPAYVKPYVKTQKNDAADAEGIPDHPSELTIDDAAAMLKVALAYIIARIEDGTLPCRIVANQCMLPCAAVETHDRQVLAPRRAAMDEIYALDRELGGAFDPPPPKTHFRS